MLLTLKFDGALGLCAGGRSVGLRQGKLGSPRSALEALAGRDLSVERSASSGFGLVSLGFSLIWLGSGLIWIWLDFSLHLDSRMHEHA